MNKYNLGEPININIQPLINIMQENNREITTKKGKGKLPLFSGNREQVIPIYGRGSPGKNKDALTINDSEYYESDEHEVEISDSGKQVEASKEPIRDTHIFDWVCNLSVGVVSVELDVTGVGIIGRGGCGITQGVIDGGTGIIGRNVVTDVLTDSNKIVFRTDMFPLNPFKSKTLVLA